MSGREKIWYDNRVIWVTLPDDDVEEQSEHADLWPELILALECLTPKQRFVIECRYGLRRGIEGEQVELESIAYFLGITKQAVKRLEERGIARMQRWSNG